MRCEHMDGCNYSVFVFVDQTFTSALKIHSWLTLVLHLFFMYRIYLHVILTVFKINRPNRSVHKHNT